MMTTEKEFEQRARSIRSEQMPLGDMMILFRDEPRFAEWYKQKYFAPQPKAQANS
tara:strand:- start:970 stop:1134 length:165 start_codon:yes stop_codon:yes gene_type:complete